MNTWTRWPSVDRSPTPEGWRRPGNLMPAMGPRRWPSGRRPASEAEEILASAEAWWDVDRSGFRDGDRFLRNIGSAGRVLDLRLGSSIDANNNDPKWLGPEDTGYVYLPGVNANYLSVADATALQITGDIDLRAQVALDTWTPSTFTALVAKAASGGTTNGYMMSVNTNGTLQMQWGNGTTVFGKNSTVAVGATAGKVKWVRATLTVNNGASQNEARFYTSDDGLSWTQLGATVTTAGTTNIATSTTAIGVGCSSGGVQYAATGKVYRAQVYDGIAGTLVLDVNCDVITSGSASSFTEQSANAATVTINRATSGRKSVAMPARSKGGRPCMLLGTDDYLECQDAAQHGLLNFYGSDSFTVLAVTRRWATGTGLTFAKRAGATTGVGWNAYVTGTTPVFAVGDQYGFIPTNTNGTITYGANTPQIFIRNRVLRVRVGSTTPADSTDTTTNLSNTQPFRVGVRSDGSTFADMELQAIAVWRRALTAREINIINTAAIWGT